MSSVASRLLDRLNETPEAVTWWRPRIGDRIAGQVVQRLDVGGRYGSRQAIIIETDDRARYAVVLTKVLLDEFSDVGPGWYVALEFAGKQGTYLQYKAAKMSPEQAQKEEVER